MDSRCYGRSRVGPPIFRIASPGYRLRDLLPRYALAHFLVAARVTPLHQLGLPEAMTNLIDATLEHDHASLDKLLTKLDQELAAPHQDRAFELLDLFWARLAVHIRAEHLHLFPALINAASGFSADDSLPSFAEVEEAIAHLRSDHDFFMKELADMIKNVRDLREKPSSIDEELERLRERLSLIRTRLKSHNQLEEEHVYVWPSRVLDQKTFGALVSRVQHELENLPPRFALN